MGTGDADGPIEPAAQMIGIQQRGTDGGDTMMNGANTLATSAMVLCALATTTASAQDLLWIDQGGTKEYDRATGIAVDSDGNAHISGETRGSIGGPGAGEFDAFVAVHNASGTVLWQRQLGTSAWDRAYGVAVDGAGSTYITGFTGGNLAGLNAGGADVFVAKYDASGTMLWTRQFGTSSNDIGHDVAVDGAGNTYVTGWTGGSLGGPSAGGGDVFVAKYDALGTMLWMLQFGTSFNEIGFGVAVDGAGDAYIAGHGHSDAEVQEAFLAKCDASGALLWTRQISTTSPDGGRGVAVDSAGNAYIAGYTDGDLGGRNAGSADYFLAKYDTSGNMLWTRQSGTPANDEALSVAVDGAGSAYITGYTEGSLGGQSAGSADFFVAKYDTSGTLLWMEQAGTPAIDFARGIAVDSVGCAYISGYTFGSLGRPSAGSADYFLTKYSQAPCYADCDKSTGPGVLDMADFLCFQNSFVNGETYACDCDTTTGNGVCDIFDFLCFQDAFVVGCP